MNAPNPRLRGNRDIVYILLTVLVVGTITGFLLDHLHTRHLLFSVARERSMTAYEVRKLKEEARHLRLEERIREASVLREEAPDHYSFAPHDRTVRIQLRPEPNSNTTPNIDRGNKGGKSNEDAKNDEGQP